MQNISTRFCAGIFQNAATTGVSRNFTRGGGGAQGPGSWDLDPPPHAPAHASRVATLDFVTTWELVHQLLQVRLRVAKLAEDLLGTVGGLDEGLVVGEGQLLGLSLNKIVTQIIGLENDLTNLLGR